MPAADQFARQVNRKKNLLIFGGLLAVILILNGVIGLFALNDTNETNQADLRTFGQINQALETAQSAQVHLKKQVQEWKDILLRGSDPKEFAHYQDAFTQEERAVDADLVSLAGLVKELQFTIPDIEQVHQTHVQLGLQYREALKAYQTGDFSTAQLVDKKVRGIDRAPTSQMDEIVNQIQAQANDFPKKVSVRTQAHYEIMRRVSIGGTVAGVVIILFLLGFAFVALSRE
ncbi:MAG TPA: hypothetical protein VGO57_18085 [Verrucomicrobiae bacterium]|jgi:methyl-accepting chemotaxis protein